MSSIYQKSMLFLDKFVPEKIQPLWHHPAGPKTIFFWGPFFKWGLVLAGLGDLQRPPETLSIPQALSLAVSGTIWSRYSVVIIPKNYGLLSVNMFVAGTQTFQLYRAVSYQMSLQNKKDQ